MAIFQFFQLLLQIIISYFLFLIKIIFLATTVTIISCSIHFVQNIVPRGKIETNKKTRVGKLRKHHKKKKEKKKTSIRRSSMSALAIKPGRKTRFNSTVQPTFIETTPCKKARRDFRFSKPSSGRNETCSWRGSKARENLVWRIENGRQ